MTIIEGDEGLKNLIDLSRVGSFSLLNSDAEHSLVSGISNNLSPNRPSKQAKS